MTRYEPPLEEMPGWRRALRSFVDAGHRPGDIVSGAWLDAELGLARPTSGTFADFERFKLTELRLVSEFRERLLDGQQLALVREGADWRVLTASEQLAMAQEEGRRRMRSAARWQANMLLNTDVGHLTDRERAEHAEAVAKMARLKAMTRPVRRAELPPPTDEGPT